MQPPHQSSRINLDELKAQIAKKLGPEVSKQYFYYLQRFLSLKLSKVEFNKLCLRVLGRENIPLHNQFIRSILRNACCAKAPPPVDGVSKNVTYIGSQDGIQQNGSHIGMPQAPGSPGLSNGSDMLPLSPKKARSAVRDRRSGDRRSALGPNGKISFAPQVSVGTQAVLENGDLNVRKPERSTDGSALVHKKDQTELVFGNDRKEASVRSPLRAPLGVPLCPVSIGGACRAVPQASSSRFIGTFDDGALLDSHTLSNRMEHIATAQGLEGVSVDCANILNHGLDSYLKGLIWSCMELVGAKSGHELTKNNAFKHHTRMKLMNSVKPGHHQYHIPNSGIHQNHMQEQKIFSPISLQEFRVAMELNPRQLGEDWPLLLEKICIHAFEE